MDKRKLGVFGRREFIGATVASTRPRHSGNLLLAALWMVLSIPGVMNLLLRASKWPTFGSVTSPQHT